MLNEKIERLPGLSLSQNTEEVIKIGDGIYIFTYQSKNGKRVKIICEKDIPIVREDSLTAIKKLRRD